MKRTTSQKSRDEQRHFKQHTHSVITTYRRFFEDEPAYFSIRKQNRSFCSNISPQPRSFLPKSRIAAPLPGRTSWVMKTINSENRSQDVQPVCFWYKNANIHIHRAGSCNFNQSRAEAVPVGLSRSAPGGEGEDPKIKYPVFQALARSGAAQRDPILLAGFAPSAGFFCTVYSTDSELFVSAWLE